MALLFSFIVTPIVMMFPRERSGWLVLGLLLLTSAVTLVQVETSNQSYAQFVTQTSYPPGISTTGHMHTGSRTWTNVGNRTFAWLGNTTWDHMGNRTWGSRTVNQTWTNAGSQIWNRTYTGNWTFTQAANLTGRGRGVVPGLATDWAYSNMTVAARNLTQPILLNGTRRVRLGFIVINASSNDQMIRNVAFNESVFQIEFDHNGSIQLTVNSSVEPSQVYADGNLLSQAPSLTGLTPQSEAWVYDANSHALTIFADPASVTLIYAVISTPTPVPEYPSALYLVLIGCLVVTILFARNSRSPMRPAYQHRLRK